MTTSNDSASGSPLSSLDRLGDELAVQVEADRGDVPALRAAEQVARTADLEVAHRELEARAEVGELADRLEPLVRLLAQHPVGRVEQVGVGTLAPPADPAPQLVELREAEQVRAVDDHRVHGRHVEPALDDRRAHEHVVLASGEVEHDALEPALVHLAVRDRDARLGHELAHLRGDVLDVLHPVVDVEDLPLAEQLAPDRLGHRALVVLADVGQDRLALLGRRLHQGEVADAGEAHLERARDRCRREREDVDVRPQPLDLLLVLHAEALLLVDDEQAQVLQLHVVGEEAVRADDHVDRAGRDVGDDRLLLLLT